MKSGAQTSALPDGRRLHLHHGPIDLIIEVWGRGRLAAYTAAAERFETVLEDIVEELPRLRECVADNETFSGKIAQRMQAATVQYLPGFVTPMAAVAGAVADEIIYVIGQTPGVQRAYVNNGGDVAFHLASGEVLTADIGGGLGRAKLLSEGCVRGVATSGWRGRSLSFGIADAVTVLASTAAMADVAATMIANEVDLPGHPGIVREMADTQQIDSDLGTRMVTVSVPMLSDKDVATALHRGCEFAAGLKSRHGVWGGLLCLQGQTMTFGGPSLRKALNPI